MKMKTTTKSSDPCCGTLPRMARKPDCSGAMSSMGGAGKSKKKKKKKSY